MDITQLLYSVTLDQYNSVIGGWVGGSWSFTMYNIENVVVKFSALFIQPSRSQLIHKGRSTHYTSDPCSLTSCDSLKILQILSNNEC